MRILLLLGLLAFLLVAGIVGTVSGQSRLPIHDESAATPVVSSADTPDGGGNTTLITRDELYRTVVDADRDASTASLYFVAQNGTWYNAYSNGTVGAIAPSGAEIPNIEDESANVPDGDRPMYVWKVTLDGCGTTLYDASTGDGIASYPIPGCGVPTPSAALTTATQEGQQTEGEAPVIGRGPGFGVVVTLAAMLVVVILLLRR